MALKNNQRLFRNLCYVSRDTYKRRKGEELTGFIISKGCEDYIIGKSECWTDHNQLRLMAGHEDGGLYLNKETIKRLAGKKDIDGLIPTRDSLEVVGGVRGYEELRQPPLKSRHESGARKMAARAISFATNADVFTLSQGEGFVRYYMCGYYIYQFAPPTGMVQEYKWCDGEKELVGETLLEEFDFSGV